MRRLILTLAVAGVAGTLEAQEWRAMGPPGGEVRAMTADPRNPQRLYLGATDGHIFGSRNAGESWELLGRAGERRDGVITAILVDPRNSRRIYASLWTLDATAGGGVYRSEDGGRTWQAAGLARQGVRALAQSELLPDVLVAGTLDGIYRSRDAGKRWERISPEGHEEIRNLDSLALDPRDPEIIYAGTFHLPWKTTDGGRNWAPIHTGMIDDSDVMSIAVDRVNAERIYASACSGIYQSENGGALWRKIQGIPYSARRTHVITQHPVESQIIYAGTTEGLWKTADGGATWNRVTPREWVINALVVQPGRLVMGTEREGVLVSEDGGANFRASNEGFQHRQVLSLALDPDQPQRVLAVLANSNDSLLATEDGGRTWAPLGPGLEKEKLLRVYAAPDGWWASLERGGLRRYDTEKGRWVAEGRLAPEAGKAAKPFAHVVSSMAFGESAWYAATPEGLHISQDAGETWRPLPLGPVMLAVSSVRVSRDGLRLWIVSLRGMVFSRDAGATWTWHDLPPEADGALRLDVADDHTLLAIARKGLYISRDLGKSWSLAAYGLPDAPLQDLATSGDVFLAAMQTGGLYVSRDRGQTWARLEGRLAEGHFPVVLPAPSSSASRSEAIAGRSSPAATGPAAPGASTAAPLVNVIFAGSASEGLFAVELSSHRTVGASEHAAAPRAVGRKPQ